MTPHRSVILVLADVNERNLDYSDQIMFFGVIVVIPNLEVQILRFIGNSSPYLESLIPFRIQTSNRVSHHLIATKLGHHISIHIPREKVQRNQALSPVNFSYY